MSESKKPNIINEINSFSDCEVAIFTTFSFEISFFEKSIWSVLNKNRARVCVFVDSKKFKESITETNSDYIGLRYFVHPFEMDKAFHPKLILLLNKKRAKLIVSSANLTFSSYYRNNELFQTYEYGSDNGDEGFVDLITQAFKFFRELVNETEDRFLAGLFRDIIEKYTYVLAQDEQTNTTKLLTNYSESIVSQLSRIVVDEIKTIRVAVPFYDEELGALSYIKKKYKNADIVLYMQDNNSTFPLKKYDESNKLISLVNVFKTVKNNGADSNSFYHGKVFNFISDSKEYILFGSANFSVSALLRSYKDGGNLEACILDSGDPGSFDNLFNTFVIKDTNVVDLKTMTLPASELGQEETISFIRGITENGKTEVIIKTNIDLEEANIKIDGFDKIITTTRNISNNQFAVCFINEMSLTIFNLNISYNDLVYCVRCFAYNSTYLDSYFRSSNKDPFKNLKTVEAIEDYHKTDFFKYFYEVINDIKLGLAEEARNTILVRQSDVNDDTEENKETDEDEAKFDYLYESPDFVISTGNFEIYKNATAYLSYFVDRTSKLLKGHGRKGKQKKKKENTGEEQSEDEEKKRNKPSINKKILGYFREYSDLRNTKINGLTFDYYFKLYVLFSETFICEMYQNNNSKMDILELDEIKIDFIKNRLLPSLDSDSSQFDHFKDQLALLCLECVDIKDKLSINYDNLINELIKMDKLFDGSFIDEILQRMLSVGTNLEINNVNLKIYSFKHSLPPKKEELEVLIYKQFKLLLCDFAIDFDKSTMCLNIDIKVRSRKENFKEENPPWILTSFLVNKIQDFIQRYYDVSDGEFVSFEINIIEFTTNISKLSLKWDSNNVRKYRRVITFAKAGKINEDYPDLINSF